MTPERSDRSKSIRPDRCAECGTRNPQLINEPSVDTEAWTFSDHWVCRHRRACEARQMLWRGETFADAAAHAQRLR